LFFCTVNIFSLQYYNRTLVKGGVVITVQWRVVYTEDGVRKETRLVITGNTYGDVCPAYIEKLSAFKRVLQSELIEFKEEKEKLCQGLLIEQIA
jgi:hypothetical protein